jgi:hypothetical protein
MSFLIMDSSTTVYDLHDSVRPQEQPYGLVVYLGLSDTDPVFDLSLLLLPSVHSSHQSAESYVTSHVQYHVWKEKGKKKDIQTVQRPLQFLHYIDISLLTNSANN